MQEIKKAPLQRGGEQQNLELQNIEEDRQCQIAIIGQHAAAFQIKIQDSIQSRPMGSIICADSLVGKALLAMGPEAIADVLQEAGGGFFCVCKCSLLEVTDVAEEAASEENWKYVLKIYQSSHIKESPEGKKVLESASVFKREMTWTTKEVSIKMEKFSKKKEKIWKRSDEDESDDDSIHEEEDVLFFNIAPDYNMGFSEFFSAQLMNSRSFLANVGDNAVLRIKQGLSETFYFLGTGTNKKVLDQTQAYFYNVVHRDSQVLKHAIKSLGFFRVVKYLCVDALKGMKRVFRDESNFSNAGRVWPANAELPDTTWTKHSDVPSYEDVLQGTLGCTQGCISGLLQTLVSYNDVYCFSRPSNEWQKRKDFIRLVHWAAWNTKTFYCKQPASSSSCSLAKVGDMNYADMRVFILLVLDLFLHDAFKSRKFDTVKASIVKIAYCQSAKVGTGHMYSKTFPDFGFKINDRGTLDDVFKDTSCNETRTKNFSEFMKHLFKTMNDHLLAGEGNTHRDANEENEENEEAGHGRSRKRRKN